ncbi:hypothetical protein OZX56_02770 [Lactobacillus sp. ESL0684]|uniref:hypothetical protein n=1 Tax=Lactobacillus sp. ESL0684 TaxID=2983213 RepID=UPI0023F90CE2|nr:hypothetical protein [Lactobacillus sp. ESL0684]WEV44169.1 hypothetical protein OZX56_02770 [Lactobacillus sp. ESL0684]
MMKMNKKRIFLAYAAVSALLVCLARVNWSSYLSAAKLWQINFAWITKPMVFALLATNLVFFDSLAVWLPRSGLHNISPLMQVRKPTFKQLIKNIAPQVWQYLVIFLLVHVFAFDYGNWGYSLLTLLGLSLLWLACTFCPVYHWPVGVQNLLVMIGFFGVRLALCYWII